MHINMLRIHLIIGDVNFDHLGKVMSSRFLHHSYWFYILNKYFVVRYFKNM